MQIYLYPPQAHVVILLDPRVLQALIAPTVPGVVDDAHSGNTGDAGGFLVPTQFFYPGQKWQRPIPAIAFPVMITGGTCALAGGTPQLQRGVAPSTLDHEDDELVLLWAA